jgi:hypothetical protein
VKSWLESVEVWLARVTSQEDAALALAWIEEQPFTLDDLDDLDAVFAVCEERSPFPQLFECLRDFLMAEAVTLLR